MSLNRNAVQRDANEPEIVDALEACGYTVWRLDVPCDLLVGGRGVNHLLEVKMPGQKPRRGQKKRFALWRGRITVVENVDQALIAVGAIQAPKLRTA